MSIFIRISHLRRCGRRLSLAALLLCLSAFTARAQLSGSYTINPSGSGSSNFTSFQMAVDTLNAKGVSGPVTFKVANGTYNEQITLTAVTGASSTNTITFQSASGDSAKVLLTYASSTSSTNNFTLYLNGADYFTFKQMTIQRSGTSTYGRAVAIDNNACHNNFTGNRMLAALNTSSSSCVVYSSDYNDTGNVFMGNVLKYGYYSFYYYGYGASSLEPGTVIKNNIIDSAYYYGLNLYYQDAPQITGNTITNPRNTTFYCIYPHYCDNGMVISNNYVNAGNTSTLYGIYIYYCDGGSARGLIANNMLALGGSGTVYGIYPYYSSDQDIVYNSVLVTSTGSTTRAFYGTGSSSYTGNKIYNNIFANTGGGYAYYLTSGGASGVSASDYNDLYAPNSSYMVNYSSTDYSSLSAFQTASGTDAHSLSTNPRFKSSSDLHVGAAGLNTAATPLSTVTTDYDGETRNSSTPDIGADEFTPPSVDAAITKLESPMHMCSGTGSIKIRVRNTGLDPIDSVQITYLIDGVQKSQMFYNLKGLTSAHDTVITLGSISVSSTSQALKAYVSLPNNSTDGDASNDTLNGNIISAMGGSYSIGSSGDYSSFTAAVNALVSRGVCSSVTFNVADSTYTEQISIPEIPGGGSSNTITFVSNSHDSTKVKLQYASSTSSANNYVVQLSGADYIGFAQLTIARTGSSTYGRVIDIGGGATNCRFWQNIITGVYTGSASNSRALFYSSSDNDDNLSISNNVLHTADEGIYLYGTGSANLEKGLVIMDNKVDSIYDYTVYLYYQDAPTVSYNTMTNILSTSAYGIRTAYSDNYLIIKDNKIEMPNGGYGIYVYYSDASSSQRGLIANNMLSLGGSGTAYGIYLYNSTYQDVVYNTVHVYGTGTGKAMYAYASSSSYSGNRLYNNIFANTGGTVAIEVSSSGTTNYLSASDYNDLYATGSTLGSWGGTGASDLASWQSASGMDANSVSGNPNFTSNTDLHVRSGLLNGKAMIYSGVSRDIDGDTRSTSPDIGADEFTPPAKEIGVVNFVSPEGGTCGDSATQVTVTVANFGANSQSSFTITLKATNGTTTTTYTKTYSSTLAAGTSDTITLTHALNTYAGGSFTLKAYTSLSGDANLSNDTTTSTFTFNGIPKAPSVKGDSICGSGSVTLNVYPGGSSVRWFSSMSSGKPVSTDSAFTTPVLTSTTTYYVDATSSTSAQVGPASNSFGTGASYAFFTDGLVFDALSDFVLDSVYVYPGSSGNVVVNIYDNSGATVFKKTVSVSGSGRTAIPLGFKIPAGTGYTIDADGSTVSDLYRNNSGASYPFSYSGVVDITGPINALSGYYYFFYDWHVTVPGCPSPRVPVTVKVLDAPSEVSILKGSTFDGSFNSGTPSDPDKVCALKTVSYELNPPKGFSNSDFGTTWTITALALVTPNGYVAGDTSLVMPGSGNGMLTFKPRVGYSDSTFIIVSTIKDLTKGCDTTVMRYIRVLPVPKANFGFVSACVGKDVAFADSSDVGFSISTYLYRFGDGSTSRNRFPTHVYSQAGNYNVTLLVTNGNGCSDSITKTVTVYPVPSIGFSDISTCAGSTVTFNDTSSIASGTLSYLWDFGSGNTSTDRNPSFTFSSPGLYTIWLKVTSSYGCSDSIKKNFQVFPRPAAAFSSRDVCIGESMQFNSTTTGSGYTYRWHFGDGSDSTGKSPAHTYAAAGSYDVSLVIINGNGCSDSITKTVNVNARPVAGFSTSDVCSGTTAMFTNSDTTSTNTYAWDFGDGMNSTDRSPAHVYNTAGTYTVMLTVTNASQCTDTVSRSITIHPLPVAGFSGSSVCLGDTTMFTDNSSISSGSIVSHSWNFGDGKTSTDASPMHNYAASGTYTVWLKVSSDNGCMDSTSQTVNVYALPDVSFSASVNERTASFTPSDTGMAYYIWSFGDNSADSGATVQHTYANDGLYSVSLLTINANGCSDLYTDTVRIHTSGIYNPVANKLQLQLYPNPYREALNLSYTLPRSAQVQITVYDLNGKAVATVVKGQQAAGKHLQTLDAASLNMPAGVYMVRIAVDDTVVTRQVIKL